MWEKHVLRRKHVCLIPIVETSQLVWSWCRRHAWECSETFHRFFFSLYFIWIFLAFIKKKTNESLERGMGLQLAILGIIFAYAAMNKHYKIDNLLLSYSDICSMHLFLINNALYILLLHMDVRSFSYVYNSSWFYASILKFQPQNLKHLILMQKAWRNSFMQWKSTSSRVSSCKRLAVSYMKNSST